MGHGMVRPPVRVQFSTITSVPGDAVHISSSTMRPSSSASTWCACILALAVRCASEDAVVVEEVAPPLVILTSPPDVKEDAVVREPSSSKSAVAWFQAGVDAYLSEDWSGCIDALEKAIVEWTFFRQANVDCRLRCADEARRAPRLFADDVDHLQYAEEMVRSTLCIMKCKRQAFRGRQTPDFMSFEEQRPFRELKTYEYLQLCYFQEAQLQKAASAVFTILAHTPQNEMMRHNFKYYVSMKEVDLKNIVNYESERYVPYYLTGTEAYYKENYELAVTKLERSLKEFFQGISECRADCEGPFDQGWLPDFTSSVANHFVYCLKCKSKCHSKLSHLNGEYMEDLLPSHYHYLQFAYFKIGRLSEACAAATTYLMFVPSDDTMVENIEFYKSLPKVQLNMFQPREEVVQYIKRQSYEEALLRFISDEFVFEDTENEDQLPESEETFKERNSVLQSQSIEEFYIKEGLVLKVHSENELQLLKLDNWKSHQNFAFISEDRQKLQAKQRIKYPLNESQHRSKLNTKVKGHHHQQEVQKYDNMVEIWAKLNNSTDRQVLNIRREEELQGAQRFSVDGLATKRECQHLVRFALEGGVVGDGYDGNESPHSFREKFAGVTLGRAALMVHFGLIKLDTLNLILEMSERGRNITADYFNIPKDELHFSYTHLVCRTAIPGKPWNATLLSHEIHADNCWLLKDGNCIRADPAYFWRDYSAILYLNDNFEGGDFIFSKDQSAREIEALIKPTCGRLVGFSSGRENLHGVQGVKLGSRCALALWFTLDPKRAEWGRILTHLMLYQLENGLPSSKAVIENLQKLTQFDINEVQKQTAKAPS